MNTKTIEPGQHLSHQAGRVTITVTAQHIAGAMVYRVESLQGGTLLLDEWTRAYPTESKARAAARHAARAFHTHRDVNTIDRRREDLQFVVRDQLNRRGPWRDDAALAAAERELDELLTLNDLAAHDRLAADLAHLVK